MDDARAALALYRLAEQEWEQDIRDIKSRMARKKEQGINAGEVNLLGKRLSSTEKGKKKKKQKTEKDHQ